jgi:hypothetical protein
MPAIRTFARGDIVRTTRSRVTKTYLLLPENRPPGSCPAITLEGVEGLERFQRTYVPQEKECEKCTFETRPDSIRPAEIRDIDIGLGRFRLDGEHTKFDEVVGHIWWRGDEGYFICRNDERDAQDEADDDFNAIAYLVLVVDKSFNIRRHGRLPTMISGEDVFDDHCTFQDFLVIER